TSTAHLTDHIQRDFLAVDLEQTVELGLVDVEHEYHGVAEVGIVSRRYSRSRRTESGLCEFGVKQRIGKERFVIRRRHRRASRRSSRRSSGLACQLPNPTADHRRSNLPGTFEAHQRVDQGLTLRTDAALASLP